MPNEKVLSQQEFDDCLIHGTLQDQRRLHGHDADQRQTIAELQGEALRDKSAAEVDHETIAELTKERDDAENRLDFLLSHRAVVIDGTVYGYCEYATGRMLAQLPTQPLLSATMHQRRCEAIDAAMSQEKP